MNSFTPTKKNNPCPVCGNTKGKCRTTPSKLVLCMTHPGDRNIPGWHYVGDAYNGLWGKFFPVDSDRPQGFTNPKPKPQPDDRPLLNPAARDRAYRQFLDGLHLAPDHRENLRKRGLNDEQIARGGFVTLERNDGRSFGAIATGTRHRGIFIPIRDANERLLGGQIRLDKGDNGRYRWPKSGKVSSHLPNGELPLQVAASVGEPQRVVSIEGTLKPYTVAQLWPGTVAIGASGGNFTGCQKQFQQALAAYPGLPILFAPDAGSLANPHVCHRDTGTIKLLREWGFEPQVLDWGQLYNKQALDLDDWLAAGGDVGAITTVAADDYLAVTATDAPPPPELIAARREILAPLGKHKPHLKVCSPDLSEDISPELMPQTGTLAFVGGKGTGKTKLIARITKASDAAISLGHRISLQRGLSHRLGLDYLGDCDRARGYLINKNGEPTRKIGLCWDSLLGVPAWLYADGSYELICDEADEGFKHLISGATCGKDGKRPGLVREAIARIKGARRVILASATLTRHEIDLVARLRGETPFILQNTYTKNAAPIKLYTGQRDIEGSAKQARNIVLAELRQSLLSGKRAIVATDQIRTTKAILEIAREMGIPDDQILIYNRQTATESEQKEFAENPDEFLARRNIILLVHSPSLTSGVSIESNSFDVVFGIFEGQTIAPDDALQALGRYRKPVQRIVYASHYGRTRGARTAAECQAESDRKQELMTQKTGRNIATRDGEDPIALYHAATQAERNTRMANFSASLQALAELQGHQVERHTPTTETDTEINWQSILNMVSERDRKDIHEAAIITTEMAAELRDKQTLKHADALSLTRYNISDWYQIAPESLALEDVRRDRKGRYRSELARLEALLWEGMARKRDTEKLAPLQAWNEPAMQHDLPVAELRSKTAIELGIPDLIQKCIENPGWHAGTDWVIEFAGRLRSYGADGQLIFGFRINSKMTDVAIVGMVLKYFGLSTSSQRQTISGRRPWCYSVSEASLDLARSILQRRAESSTQQGLRARPHPLSNSILEGVAGTKPPPDPVIDRGKTLEWANTLQSIATAGIDWVKKAWREHCIADCDGKTQQAILALLPQPMRIAIEGGLTT